MKFLCANFCCSLVNFTLKSCINSVFKMDVREREKKRGKEGGQEGGRERERLHKEGGKVAEFDLFYVLNTARYLHTKRELFIKATIWAIHSTNC